ncbi:MAG: rod shape-determining protein MreD [Desulfobacteraceae bacterium]|nr:rod shape-determining protein MreD [Desulfobacteraceae bacterium]MBC2755896.1 rod shape-determining protein MreD [Desulfobacteraceae bacterium]
MHFLVYFIFSILLVCIQTTLLPAFPRLFAQYDLLIPFVVYLTLFRSSLGILPVILISGCLMDLLSGGTIGVYIATYILILICFRNTTVYFHFKNSTLFQIVVILSVLIENIIFGMVILLQTLTFNFSFYAGSVVAAQLIWALISSPLVYFMFDYIFNGIDKIITGGLRERV